MDDHTEGCSSQPPGSLGIDDDDDIIDFHSDLGGCDVKGIIVVVIAIDGICSSNAGGVRIIRNRFAAIPPLPSTTVFFFRDDNDREWRIPSQSKLLWKRHFVLFDYDLG